MQFRSMVSPFIDTLSIRTNDTVRKYTGYLNKCIDIIELEGLDFPSENYYSNLEAYLLNTYAESTAKHILSLAKKFFAWLQQQKGDMQMIIPADLVTDTQTDTQTGTQNVSGLAKQEEAPIPPADISDADNSTSDETPDTQKRKPGRKPKGDEKRTEKISIYLTPSLLLDAKDLANFDGIKFSDYLYSVIQQDVSQRQDKIKALRALRS